MGRPKKEKQNSAGNGLPAAKKEPFKGAKPIVATPDELAQKLRGIAFALTPLIVHLEGEQCPLIADELSKCQKKLEENANFISEVSRLGRQKDLFAEVPPAEKVIYAADCPKGDYHQEDFQPLPPDMRRKFCPNCGEKLTYIEIKERRLAKTLLTLDAPDKKSAAAGKRVEAT